MKHLILATIVAGIAAGCSSSGGSSPAHTKETPTSLAAYAGQVNYPTKFKPYLEPSIVATVDRRSGMMTLRNFGNAGVMEPRIWVNEVFVYRVPQIGPKSTIMLKRDNFYDSAGRSLKGLPPSAINKIQIETSESLIDVQGPMAE